MRGNLPRVICAVGDPWDAQRQGRAAARRHATSVMGGHDGGAQATAQETPAVDVGVPRKLATNLFLGECAAAHNVELLAMLGIARVMQLVPAPTEGTSALVAEEAAAAAAAVCTEVVIVDDAAGALAAGEAASLLSDCATWLTAATDEASVLVAGDLNGAATPHAAWIACAFVAADEFAHADTAEAAASQRAVVRAYKACRRAYPALRMSAQLAREAEAFARAWRDGGCEQARTAARRARGRRSQQRENAAHQWQWIRVHGAAPSASPDAPPPSIAQSEAAAPSADAAGGSPAPVEVEATSTPPEAAAAPAAVAAGSAGRYSAQRARAEAEGAFALRVNLDDADDSSGAAPVAVDAVWYRCSRCRTRLFSESMLEPHAPGGGQAAFKHRKRDGASTNACTSFFLRSDVTYSLDEHEGKMCCPRCSARLGSFNWAGMQC